MMRSHWEKLGILGLVYGIVGRGFSDGEIAGILGISEDKVRQCVRWLLRFESHSSRAELALEALASIPTHHGREAPGRRFGFQPLQTSQLERLHGGAASESNERDWACK